MAIRVQKMWHSPDEGVPTGDKEWQRRVRETEWKGTGSEDLAQTAAESIGRILERPEAEHKEGDPLSLDVERTELMARVRVEDVQDPEMEGHVNGPCLVKRLPQEEEGKDSLGDVWHRAGRYGRVPSTDPPQEWRDVAVVWVKEGMVAVNSLRGFEDGTDLWASRPESWKNTKMTLCHRVFRWTLPGLLPFTRHRYDEPTLYECLVFVSRSLPHPF